MKNNKKSENTKKLAELAGWYGTVAIIVAYALVSFNAISSGSLSFQLLNLTGALGIIIISATKGVRQSVVLNAFWAVIAVLAILNMSLKLI